MSLSSAPSFAGDTPVMVVVEDEVAASAAERVSQQTAKHRPIRKRLALPSAGVSLDQQTRQQRKQAIALALDRAKARESEAAFADCVREAAAVLSEATEVLAETGELELLRSLHLQIGACMVLSNNAASARLHFRAALMLDEKLPPVGLFREEVEQELAASAAETRSRSRGQVEILSDPPGAEVWIDGRKQKGLTPLRATVRLGDHYVTLRRFRFEPQTVRTVLQPTGRVRFTLEAASRRVLSKQLADARRKRVNKPSQLEWRLAMARWARAEQLLLVSAAGKSGKLRLELIDADLGETVRTGVSGEADDDVTRSVCKVLGESCEPPASGAPWWVWPIVGAAVVAGGVAVGVVVERERDVVFCPPRGC